MIAHLYIMAESFSHNANFSNNEIEEKIKRLAEDLVLINKYKDTNRLYTNYDEIYPVVFYEIYTVFDFICRPQELRSVGIDRDVINALQNIFQKTESIKITSAEVREEILNWTDDENCYGIVAFHEVDGIDENYQIIYGIDGWYKFRRYFLSVYPHDVEFYIDECVKYFPRLTFHPRNRNTIRDIFPDFVKSVIKHLGYLNDIFYNYRYRSFENESQKYKTLSIECQLEEYAASKDRNAAKETLTFDFYDSDSNIIKIICYPHLRLCKADSPGDSRYYQNRIYFHEGFPNVSNGNILIGHIGGHLN